MNPISKLINGRAPSLVEHVDIGGGTRRFTIHLPNESPKTLLLKCSAEEAEKIAIDAVILA